MTGEKDKKQLTLEEFGNFFQTEILPVMEARFATKEDFNRFVDASFKHFVTKDDINGLASREELVKFRNEILTGQDKILRRIDDLEIDSGAHTLLYDRQRDQLDEHEKRIGQVEGKLSVG